MRFRSCFNDDYCEFCMHYTRMMRKSMLGHTVLNHSAFVFVLGVTLFLICGEKYRMDILLNFLFYVIFTPAIATAMSADNLRIAKPDAIGKSADAGSTHDAV